MIKRCVPQIVSETQSSWDVQRQKAPREWRTLGGLPISTQSRIAHLTPYSSEGNMENTSNILTVKEVADILRWGMSGTPLKVATPA
jgi:hypothetical protein